MADNAVLFKLVAKSVGMKYGITPTFMAKPYSDVNLSSQKTVPLKDPADALQMPGCSGSVVLSGLHRTWRTMANSSEATFTSLSVTKPAGTSLQ